VQTQGKSTAEPAGVAQGDLTMLNALRRMIERAFEASCLDPKTFMLVRIAALATLDAAPASSADDY
jgi:hypothetical protein